MRNPLTEAASGERLTGRAFYGYGLGSVASGVAGQALSTSIISQFLFLVVGMPALLVGAAIVISQVIDAIVDPILGLWSDRTGGRLGRRHPFMYASAIPCAIAFYALWHPPMGLGSKELFAYMLALLVVVRLFTAMYEILEHRPRARTLHRLSPAHPAVRGADLFRHDRRRPDDGPPQRRLSAP